jgi:Flp pilus assembly protein TadB
MGRRAGLSGASNPASYPVGRTVSWRRPTSHEHRISIDSHRAAKWSWRLLWLMMAATAIGVSTRSYFALQLFAALVLFTLLFVVLTSIVLAFFVLLEALARLLGRGMDAIRFLKRFVEDSYRAWRTA